MGAVTDALLKAGRTAAWAGLAVVVAAGATLAFSPAVRQLVTPAPTKTLVRPSPSDWSMPTPVPVATAALLPSLSPGTPPVPAALAAVLPKRPAGIAGTASTVVAQADGTVLVRRDDRPLIPASTMKLLTSLAALDMIEPGTRFRTRVLRTGPTTIVLVGGGDPLLTLKPSAGRASLTELADATARALRAEKVKKVSVGFDASLFSGPAWHGSWGPNYRYAVAPVSALMVDHAAKKNAPRSADPARSAAKAFATLLSARGIAVGVLEPTRAGAATALAEVSSPPIERVVEATLRYSDNDAAEALLRQVALAAGRPGSFAAGAQVVSKRLTERGLLAPRTVIADGSGLSRDDRVAASTLVEIISLALHEDRFRVLATGLPVGGVTGTLWDRYDDKAERRGRGVVRAKTGTLRDVSTMAGYVLTKDAGVLVFAVMANQARVLPTQDWIDRTSAALAGCGCR